MAFEPSSDIPPDDEQCAAAHAGVEDSTPAWAGACERGTVRPREGCTIARAARRSDSNSAAVQSEESPHVLSELIIAERTPTERVEITGPHTRFPPPLMLAHAPVTHLLPILSRPTERSVSTDRCSRSVASTTADGRACTERPFSTRRPSPLLTRGASAVR